MDLQLTIEVLKKGEWYIARAPELDFVSQGSTHEEAKNNLFEVIRIQFTEMKEMGTLENYLLECGFESNNDERTPKTEIVEVGMSVVTV